MRAALLGAIACAAACSDEDDAAHPRACIDIGHAIVENDVDAVRRMLAAPDESRTPTTMANLLARAAMEGRPAIVRLLLEHGADVKGGPSGPSPLALAKAAGHEDMVALLRRRGAVD